MSKEEITERVISVISLKLYEWILKNLKYLQSDRLSALIIMTIR